jgi:hypothetical protein
MKINELYKDRIKHLPKVIREDIIKEAPHTQIVGDIPDSLSFLRGTFIDLGFENLQLSRDEVRAIYKAFIGNGVEIPGTDTKLRFTRTGVTAVERGSGDAVLPSHWADAVLVLNGDTAVHIGKLVRPDQIAR